MANNPYVNKVEYAGQTVMDLTGDTVTPSDVLNGVTFHNRSGAPQTGSMITHNVYDGLDSSSANDALSANQGRVLNSNLQKIDGTKDQAISSGDLNNYTSTGLWRIGNMTALTHHPDVAGTTGILYVMVMSTYILQDFVNNTMRSSRFSYDGGTTWTDWQTVALNSKITLLNVGTVTTNYNGIIQLKNFYDSTHYTAISVRSREESNYYFSGIMNAKSATYGESVVAFNYTGEIQKNKTINGIEVILLKYA